MFVQAGSRARFDNGAPPVREGECAATQKVQEAAASPAPWTPPLLVQVKNTGSCILHSDCAPDNLMELTEKRDF